VTAVSGTCVFLTDFSKNPQISNFTKIRPVGAELFHANGRTDMTKLTVANRNFANAPKNIHCNKNAQAQQQPSQRSVSAPPQHSALPPTNTHFTPIYVFCMILAMYTPIYATFTGQPIGWKQTVLCAVRTEQLHAVQNSAVPAGTSRYQPVPRF
jgi:hypothetical protein